MLSSPLLLHGSAARLPSIQRYFFLAKVAHWRVEQLLTIKRAKVNVAHALTLPAALQGMMQRDGGHRVDVNVVEGGEFPFPLPF